MKKGFAVSGIAALAVAAVVIIAGPPTTGSGTSTDFDAVAKKLVGQCAGIKENEAVMITGGVRDLELLENLGVHARALGAFPLVVLESERMTKRMFDDVPARFDSQPPAFTLKLADSVNAIISVDSSENEALLAGMPAERMAARAKAGQPVGEKLLQRGVRQVNLGNGLYPTEALAKRFGIPREDLTRIFWDGVNVDYAQLQQRGAAVSGVLSSGKEIHIINPNGTDLTARIESRPVFVSDGVVSPEEMKKGGAACQTWLPAGEVYLAVVPGSAEGKIVVDRQRFEGKDIEGLTLTIKAGKLVSMTARSGLERLKALYDASGPGKDEFGIIDLGINSSVRVPAGSTMQAWMPAGMVTVVVGGNSWAGGDNHSPFNLSSFLPGSSVTVDGKTVVEKGTLKI